ncbi:MAG TPA: cupin domain-containing protein [Pseudonocardiaceae bacterium]
MSLPNVVPPDGGEHLVAGPVVNRILEDGSHTGQRLGVMEGSLPPGWSGPPPHVHREHEETFYVVRGAVRFTSGADEYVLTEGGLFTAPIGVPHGFGNASSDEPAQLLVTVSPQRYIEYFRELGRLRPGPDGLLDPAEIGALMARYATEPYPPVG